MGRVGSLDALLSTPNYIESDGFFTLFTVTRSVWSLAVLKLPAFRPYLKNEDGLKFFSTSG
jgi:hypothetical protein